MSAQGRILVHGEKSTASESPAHFHGQRRCFLPIWRSRKGVGWLVYPVVSNLATKRWRVNFEEPLRLP